MLIFFRYSEERENHRDDKNIINRKRFLNRKAGEVIHAGLGTKREPNAHAVKKTETDIEC